MKKSSQLLLRKIIKEEVKRVLKENKGTTPKDFIQDMEGSINEASFSDSFIGQLLIGLIASPWLLVHYTIDSIAGGGVVQDIKALRRHYENYQMKKQINEKQVQALIEKITDKLNKSQITSGKKGYVKYMINRIAKAGDNKSEILRLEKQLKQVLKKYDIDSPEELSKIDDKIYNDMRYQKGSMGIVSDPDM